MHDENEEVYPSDVATEEPGDAPDAELREEPEDYLVRCNVCKEVVRRSDRGGCPEGHLGGYSYAGPIPEPIPGEDDMIKAIMDVIDGDDPGEEADEFDPVPDYDGPGEGPPESELADDLTSVAVEQAILRMLEVQDRLDAAIEDHAEKAEIAKEAKQHVQHLQEGLSRAVRAVREARTAREPDPEKYPLLDGPRAAKEEVNGLFAKPEAIPPLPPDTFEEFCRRKARDTRLDTLGLSSRVTTAMEKAGYATVADVGKLTEASAPLTSVKGIGEAAAGQVVEALADFAQGLVDGWAELHPEPAGEGEVAE